MLADGDAWIRPGGESSRLAGRSTRLTTVDLTVAHEKAEGWKQTKDQIHATVLREGWSDKAGAFTQYFGSDELDASVLMMPLVGFLPATDPRMLATIEATAEYLTDERGVVYRYGTRGGGPEGREGAFLLCTFWLAHALALAGRPERARQVFERVISYLNDLGLLAEEVDPGTGELLGNFPQAFSHIGLVNAASAISEAEIRQTPRPAGLADPRPVIGDAMRSRWARGRARSAPGRRHHRERADDRPAGVHGPAGSAASS
jgi:Glycosyl hydrolases family 15